MVALSRCAYSKSTLRGHGEERPVSRRSVGDNTTTTRVPHAVAPHLVMEEMPLVGIWSRGTWTPKASLASSAILACTSWPSTSAVGSAEEW